MPPPQQHWEVGLAPRMFGLYRSQIINTGLHGINTVSDCSRNYHGYSAISKKFQLKFN